MLARFAIDTVTLLRYAFNKWICSLCQLIINILLFLFILFCFGFEEEEI